MNTAFLLDKTPRFILYGLILFLPVFLLPSLSSPAAFAKQIFLAAALFIASAAVVVRVLGKGSFSFKFHIAFLPLVLLPVVAVLSAYGSGSPLHSFWGANYEPDSLFNIILFTILAVITVFVLKEEVYIKNALMFFIGGAVLGSISLFLPPSFNAVGSVYAFAIYAGGALVLALWSYMTYKPRKTYRIYLLVSAAVLFWALMFIDIWVAWLGIAASMLVLVYYMIALAGSTRQNITSAAPYLVVFALASSLLFINSPISNPNALPSEVRLGRNITFDIAKSSMTSSIKNTLFGSGPATFSDQYRLHRDISINNTPFWNTPFYSGNSTITSFFITTGALGGGLVLAFWALFLFFGARSLFRRKVNKSARGKTAAVRGIGGEDYSAVVFAGGLYFFLAWLFYQFNFLLIFAGFFVAALWVALNGRNINISFIKSPQVTFFGMIGSVSLLIVIIFGSYTVFNAYIAEAAYQKALLHENDGNYAFSVSELQKASGANGLDRYWRKLSQMLFIQTSQIYKDSPLPRETKNQLVQSGISAAESAAQKAVLANPRNSVNHEQLGDFYRNIIVVSTYAINLPFGSYDNAGVLNPQSPFIPLKKARAHFEVSKRSSKQIDELNAQIAALNSRQNEEEDAQVDPSEIQSLSKRLDDTRAIYEDSLGRARENAERALELKRDFKEAIVFLEQLPLATD